MVLKGLLQDNKIYCPKCNKSNYQLTDDYKLVEIEGEKLVEFVARCMEGKCDAKFYFQSDIRMDKTIHYVHSRDKETVIKDE